MDIAFVNCENDSLIYIWKQIKKIGQWSLFFRKQNDVKFLLKKINKKLFNIFVLLINMYQKIVSVALGTLNLFLRLCRFLASISREKDRAIRLLILTVSEQDEFPCILLSSALGGNF